MEGSPNRPSPSRTRRRLLPSALVIGQTQTGEEGRDAVGEGSSLPFSSFAKFSDGASSPPLLLRSLPLYGTICGTALRGGEWREEVGLGAITGYVLLRPSVPTNFAWILPPYLTGPSSVGGRGLTGRLGLEGRFFARSPELEDALRVWKGRFQDGVPFQACTPRCGSGGESRKRRNQRGNR